MLFLQSANKISGIKPECQTVWIQIRPDILSGLIRLQTVCRGYQKKLPCRVNSFLASSSFCPLLITFANILDPDQARLNDGHDHDTLDCIPDYRQKKIYVLFFEKKKKSADDNKSIKIYPSRYDTTLNLRNSILKTFIIPTNINNFQCKWSIVFRETENK